MAEEPYTLAGLTGLLGKCLSVETIVFFPDTVLIYVGSIDLMDF